MNNKAGHCLTYKRSLRGSSVWRKAARDSEGDGDETYTPKQGQYLSFIYNYTKIHGRPPAEADLQRYFQTTPPTIHQMILTLERRGFLSRQPGQPRSIKVLLPPEDLPYLR